MLPVTPVESPTVPNAEVISNSAGVSARSSTLIRTSVAPTTRPIASRATVSACRIRFDGSRRRNTFMSVLPRTSDHSTKPSTAKVVTLMPPAVEAGPAPMNIRVVITSRVGSFMPPMSTVLKPAVLGVTPWNQPARILSNVSSGPSVAGFVHSKVMTTSGPNTSSAAVTSRVILVCSDQWALARVVVRRWAVTAPELHQDREAETADDEAA